MPVSLGGGVAGGAGGKRGGTTKDDKFSFFESQQIANCDFIYDQSNQSAGGNIDVGGDGTQGGDQGNQSGMMSTLSKFFRRESSKMSNKKVEISAMCAARDVLVIGFTNGVLILVNT